MYKNVFGSALGNFEKNSDHLESFMSSRDGLIQMFEFDCFAQKMRLWYEIFKIF